MPAATKAATWRSWGRRAWARAGLAARRPPSGRGVRHYGPRRLRAPPRDNRGRAAGWRRMATPHGGAAWDGVGMASAGGVLAAPAGSRRGVGTAAARSAQAGRLRAPSALLPAAWRGATCWGADPLVSCAPGGERLAGRAGGWAGPVLGSGCGVGASVSGRAGGRLWAPGAHSARRLRLSVPVRRRQSRRFRVSAVCAEWGQCGPGYARWGLGVGVCGLESAARARTRTPGHRGPGGRGPYVARWRDLGGERQLEDAEGPFVQTGSQCNHP